MTDEVVDLAQQKLLQLDRRLASLEARVDQLVERLTGAERIAAEATRTMTATHAHSDVMFDRLRVIERRLELADE